jgi:hypothetical protein
VAPPTKAPYRMNHEELKELKVQLKELLWRAPKSRGETHLRVSQSQVAESWTW